MNITSSLKPQILTSFDDSSKFSDLDSSQILPKKSENKFDDQSSDYNNNKTLEYSEDSEITSESSLSEVRNQKRKFSPEEDKKLRQLIEINGPKRWDQIALSLPGRTGRQCRDRFQNYLRPSLINGPWTREEDLLLEQKVYELGQHWNKIARFFKGRSSNNVKNRWYTHIYKKRQNQAQNFPGKFMVKNSKKYNNHIRNDICNGYLADFNYYYLNNNYNNYNSAINYTNNYVNPIVMLSDNSCEKFESNLLNQKIQSQMEILMPKSNNLKKILFPPICPPNNIMILPSNKDLFNFLSI